VRAIDHVQVQGFSLVGAITIGKSEIDSDTLTAININGASLINKAGDVTVATKTDSLVRAGRRPHGRLGADGDANAIATIDTKATNTVTLNDATIKGETSPSPPGAARSGTLSDLEGDANTDIMAFSLLPNIATPIPSTSIDEHNSINVTGNTKIQALQDVVLRAVPGLGAGNRAHTTARCCRSRSFRTASRCPTAATTTARTRSASSPTRGSRPASTTRRWCRSSRSC